jgi:hypothetical protein
MIIIVLLLGKALPKELGAVGITIWAIPEYRVGRSVLIFIIYA